MTATAPQGSSAERACFAALIAAAAFFVLTGVSGCGTPGAPQPPSLKLPDTVTDLAAVRVGEQVTLTWKMPRKNTDKLLLKGNIPARVCRKLENAVCEPVPGNPSFQPGVEATFTEALPAALASGAPRALTYFVELLSPKGRSAGLSNPARVVAGTAPAEVVGLKVSLRKQGAVMEWSAEPALPGAAGQAHEVIRLHRTLLTLQGDKAKSARQVGILAPAKEPVEMNLLAEEPAEGRVLDKTIQFGQTYEYRAQRVARVEVEGETVELAGPLSAPVKVEAIDTFPPAVPTGLAAVASAGEGASAASIDLSWVPVSEADLAGYAVYRREGDETLQRISPVQPVVGPAFHDADVKTGHTYHYAVTAIDQGGHESARSAEAEETVPNN